MQTFHSRRQRSQAKIKVLQQLQTFGFQDGIQQLSFDIQRLGATRWLKGWFKGRDGITYSFQWKGDRLEYKQALVHPLHAHTLTLPATAKATRRLSAEQKAVLRKRISDRATFSCGATRCPRQRSCVLQSIQVGRVLKELLSNF